MATILLLIIYLIFISLGLPDSVLGSSFPAIAENLKIDASVASYLSPLVSIGTIISSFLSPYLIKKFKAQWVVSFSIFLTAIGLLLFSFAKENTWWLLFVSTVPLGLGAGAIDSALNNYVAIHYKALHMNWLHCSWGVGTVISPLIIGAFIDSNNNSTGWNKGIIIISIIQFIIMLISFISIPLWYKISNNNTNKKEEKEEVIDDNKYTYKYFFTNPIFYLTVIGFFSYCALETTTGLWTGAYLNIGKGFSTQEAATFTSLFYIGITSGRFLSGPLSLKFKENNMIRIGEVILVISSIILIISSSTKGDYTKSLALAGICLIGLGCAPIYPAIIRLTPYRFSITGSQKAMGLEVAIAYTGNLLVPFLVGQIAKLLNNNYLILPYVLIFFIVLMITCHESINIKLNKRDKNLTVDERKEYNF